MSYIVMVMMIVIVLFAIRLLRREKRSLDAMYGQAAREAAGRMTRTKSRRAASPQPSAMPLLTVWALSSRSFRSIWMVSTSFKPDTQWFAWPPFYFPHPPTLTNYMQRLVRRRGICQHAVCDLARRSR